MFIKQNDFEMWDVLINGKFILTFSFNYRVVSKLDFHWTEEDKRKVKLGFKVKRVFISALNSKEFCYVFNCDSAKEVWDTFEIIHGVSPKTEQERTSTKIYEFGMPNEYESHSHRLYSIIGTHGGYIRTFVSNNYIRIMSCNYRSDSILNSNDRHAFVEFHEESRKEEIIKKFNEFIHPLRDKGVNSRMLESYSSRE